MSDQITPEAFDFLAAKAGLSVTPEQRKELIGVYPKIAAMIARNRNGRKLSAEPAHIFVPGEGVAP